MSRALMADIITLAAEMAMIDRKVLVGRTRYRRVVRVRQACMLLARENGHSYPIIGKAFGRDHSTIIHGCEVAEDCIKRDPIYAAFVDRLRAASQSARPYIASRLTAPVFIAPTPAPAPAKVAKPKPKPRPVDSEIFQQTVDNAAMRRGSIALRQAIQASLRAREQMRAAG